MTVLGSGSTGNSILVEASRTRILIDAGLAARDLSRRLESSGVGVRLEDISAVCVTHEHGDHSCGVSALASAGVPIHATGGTARALELPAARELAAGVPVVLGDLELVPAALHHDAAEPVGYVVSDGTMRVGVLTDCGHVDSRLAELYAACELLVLESNHDATMLRQGSYPWALKRRIAGPLGHLSNEQAAEFLALMPAPRTQVLVLAHLSRTNNRPRMARAAIEPMLGRLGMEPRVLVASRDRPLPPVTAEVGRVTSTASSDDRQLKLALRE